MTTEDGGGDEGEKEAGHKKSAKSLPVIGAAWSHLGLVHPSRKNTVPRVSMFPPRVCRLLPTYNTRWLSVRFYPDGSLQNGTSFYFQNGGGANSLQGRAQGCFNVALVARGDMHN